MGSDEVLEEIDRRMRRLEAQVELLEAQIERETSNRVPRVEDRFSLYYMLFMALWFVIGLAVLVYIRGRVTQGMKLSLGLYVLVGAVAVGAPLAYLLWPKRFTETKLEERLTAAKVALKAFYKPLKRAVQDGDLDSLRALADRLLNDPQLSTAIELANEGDPKVMAYALYLYADYRPELRDEVEELLGMLTNKPLRRLLSSRIKERL
ncbi:hypothetical protein [Thermococcus sp.]|uniref:hypothetical protein n=1 Tax=Thermococcus sp. TaxID=35749 RepID=UPI00260A2178|nr:hypothetical protein [Thermococcus sp.]